MNQLSLKLIGTCLGSLVGAAAPAAGPEFPAKLVRIVVPNPPGGTAELVARYVGQVMSPALGQNVMIDLRPGGNRHHRERDQWARARADGYTLL